MKRRPKDIGTAAETAVVRYLREHGFPGADRQPLRGNRDQGDITITAGVIAEVKAGHYAATASTAVIKQWLDETETERVNAGADIGVLIVRQARRGVNLWHVWQPAHTLLYTLTGDALPTFAAPWPVCMALQDWAQLVAGEWGDR